MSFLKKNLNEDIKKYYFTEPSEKDKDYVNVVSNYIQYYHYRAWGCKHWFYFLNFAKLFALAGIMFFQVLKTFQDISIYAVCASASSILIEGIISLTRLQEKWILYRNTNNALMSEVRKYVTYYGRYKDSENRYENFVETIENMIGDEARKWNETVKERNKENANSEKSPST